MEEVPDELNGKLNGHLAEMKDIEERQRDCEN
jgi:hypothetical protein